MTKTGLWNLEGMTEIFTEGPVSLERIWLISWIVEITEISSGSESIESARIKAVWSSFSDCSEKMDSTSSLSERIEDCCKC